MMIQWLQKWGWTIIVPFGVCGAMAALRWEWIIVALILLLLVYPFILAMLYFNYGLKPEYRRLVQPANISVYSSGVTINFENANQPVLISFNQLKNVVVEKKGLTLRLKIPKYACLHIPDDVWIADSDDCKPKEEVIRILTQNGMEFV